MIYLQETQDREGFVRRVLQLVAAELVRDARRVMIKPNIVSHEHYPTTTHPAVLRACPDYCRAQGKKVVVADGPAVDAGDSDAILKAHPLKTVCDDFGVPLLNLVKGKMQTVAIGDFDLELSAIPFEYDFIISLPVLKSHLSVLSRK